MRLVVVDGLLIDLHRLLRFQDIIVGLDDIQADILALALRLQTGGINADCGAVDGRLILAAGVDWQLGRQPR